LHPEINGDSKSKKPNTTEQKINQEGNVPDEE
jgi:hypothetical protein